MKNRLLLQLSLFLFFCSFGLRAAAQQSFYCYRIYFTDKNQTTYSLSNPIQFLSHRSIQRRAKYNIPIDSTDLPVNSSYISNVLTLTGGQLITTSKWHNTVVIALTDTNLIHNIQTAPYYKADKLVAILPSLSLKPAPQDQYRPTGTPGGEQYYGMAWRQIHLCHGEYLHQKGQMGEDMLIAVIDTDFGGVDTLSAFDSLRSQNRLVDRWNYLRDSTWLGVEDHGTKVLSCMAALQPDHFVGTAPRAKYALYVTDAIATEQTIEEDFWTAAAERADSIGADLISSSLGYNQFDQPDNSYVYSDLDGHSTYLAQTVNTAVATGIMTVVSAGNEGQSAWHYILTPGDADSAFTIGSVNAQKIPAVSSGWGPNASGKRKPDVMGLGQGARVINGSGNVIINNGTSFATPVIAGLTACLMQRMPDIPPGVMMGYIRATADHVNQPNDKIGYGVPDFEAAYQLVTAIRKTDHAADGVTVFPNPFAAFLMVQLDHSALQPRFTITAITGKTVTAPVRSYNRNTLFKIDLRSLPPGIYLLTITSGTGRITKKILKTIDGTRP